MHTEYKVIDMPQKCSEESEHICKDLSRQDNTFCRAEQPCHVHPLNGDGDCAWTGNEIFHSPQTANAVSAKCPNSQPQRLAVGTWHVTILWLPASAKAIISRFTEHLT